MPDSPSPMTDERKSDSKGGKTGPLEAVPPSLKNLERARDCAATAVDALACALVDAHDGPLTQSDRQGLANQANSHLVAAIDLLSYFLNERP